MTTAVKPRSDIERALEERTAAVDGLVVGVWRETLGRDAAHLALLAVGGYGRRQLFPHSDVDLLLLVARHEVAEARRDAISAFLQRLWDAGLRISNSVRTPEECTRLHERNTELNASLLDQRYLAGSESLYETLAARLPKLIESRRADLASSLGRLTRERHGRFQQTYHHLEPNIKEAPGGLRDVQYLDWLTRIGAARAGVLAPVEESRRFLFLLRWHLHRDANRDFNLLTFDAQERIGERIGREPEALMREYFRHARPVYRATLRQLEAGEPRGGTLFAVIRDRTARLSTSDFTVVHGRVYVRAPQQLDADPELLLGLFWFVARHGLPLSSQSEEQISKRLPAFRARLARPQPLWPAIRGILAQPHSALALRSAHETGVLEAIFPELEQIDCLVVRDFYHRYTVDEHTLVAIESLASLPERAYSDLLSELERPDLLAVALLFHDVGKGGSGEGHVDASARIAAQALERIAMPEPDRETVLFLIRSHLALSSIMNSRDLDDPATAGHVAHLVGTVERLKALTLLTYADVAAVTPAAMTPWRAEQLWRLYLVAYNELTLELEAERIAGGDSSERSAFLEGLPTRYLRTHTGAEIDAHIRLEEESRRRGVSLSLEKPGDVYRLSLVTPDRPFLFASVVGTLAGFGMNILKAEAFANRAGTVVDTFVFSDPARTLELNPSEEQRLLATLERTALGRADVRPLLKSRPRLAAPSRNARIEPQVAVDDQASAAATLVQIVAQDRPALLYDIASTLSANGCNIEVVLIDTQAHKAIDVFYVTEGGQKLAPARQRHLREALLRAVGAP